MQKKLAFILLSSVIILGGLLVGCSAKPETGSSEDAVSPKADEKFSNWLKEDARSSLISAIDRDYRELTIITGSLNQIHSSAFPHFTLGKTIGALETSLFTQNYIYKRLEGNLNISGEMKRDFLPPGLMNTLHNNETVLNHLYENIFKPWNEYQKEPNQKLAVEQRKVENQVVKEMNDLTKAYENLVKAVNSNSNTSIQELILKIDEIHVNLKQLYYPVS